MKSIEPLVGEKVVVVLIGGGEVRGELVRVNPDTLVIRDRVSLRERGDTAERERYVATTAVLWLQRDLGEESPD